MYGTPSRSDRITRNLRRLFHALLSRDTALAIVAGLAAAGCGQDSTPSQSQTSSVSGAKTEIRGEPIRAPIAPVPNRKSAVAAVDSTSASPPGSATQAAAAAKTAEAGSQGDGTSAAPLNVGFEVLSAFKYEVPAEPLPTNQVAAAAALAQVPDQIPATVRALDQQFIALKGFMLPLKVEGGMVTELLMMRDQSVCCFGAVPKINEWVSVKMSGKGVKPIMDQAVTLHGKLRVGEVRENGYLVGIYQMDGDKVIGPSEL